ncbi:hypothetical protein [Alkaliphilus sp. B6464]|uniref:hypothetical protein n=1 Tax=Alkaliphilus sp. B6464 TaxID=2731219 RepID=UPI001BADDB8B|nr:hypothetical protein [Alkaliphilus sp. B6464]QUH22152.1 hypothetical protein HYG84_19790 [Alkaliphilus sp. B6464]
MTTANTTAQDSDKTVDKNMPNENEVVSEKSTSAKGKKNNLIILTTKPISDEDLRDKLNKEFGKHNQYYKVLKEAVDNLTGKYKQKLASMILLIREGVRPDFKIEDGKVKSVEFKRKLTNEELENFVISIPVEMFFIQEYMDDRALDMEMTQHMKEFNITEKILEIQGGTEKERLRAAEYNSMISIFTTIIKNRVYYNLKNDIDQASKVYDALKRVIQLRITEMQTFGRSQEYGSPKNSLSGNNLLSNRTEYIEVDPKLANFIIKTNKYNDGISVKDLFFNDLGYFNWIKDNVDVKGVFVEYQKVIKQFKERFESLNPDYKVS